MKPVLIEIVNALEALGTRVAAIEAVLIARGYLTQDEIESQAAREQGQQHRNLANLRSRIASLPD